MNEDVKIALLDLVVERDWGQFHSPGNLIKSIAIESGELLECVQWSEDVDPARVRSELADVLTYAYLLSDRMGWDPDEVVLDKLREAKTKYPVEKAKGKSVKYDEL